jgi:hypothetical protein
VELREGLDMGPVLDISEVVGKDFRSSKLKWKRYDLDAPGKKQVMLVDIFVRMSYWRGTICEIINVAIFLKVIDVSW